MRRDRFDRTALLPTALLPLSLRILPLAHPLSIITCHFIYRRLKMHCCDTNCEFSVSTIVTQFWPEKWNKTKKTLHYSLNQNNGFHPVFITVLKYKYGLKKKKLLLKNDDFSQKMLGIPGKYFLCFKMGHYSRISSEYSSSKEGSLFPLLMRKYLQQAKSGWCPTRPIRA